jgi:ubiquinone/menaquinone biosynthesis C-methylase UbiE
MMPEYKYFVWKIRRLGIKRGRVLDIGTGSGRLAIELAKAKGCNFEIVGLDNSGDMIEKARENARRYGVADKIKFLLATGSDIPFADKSFDLVISYASLHHWFQPVDVFNEVARVTADGGSAIIRDNMRVYQNPLWHAAIWLVSRFMNRRHRRNWPGVIRASYTIPEARELINQSQLRGYRVRRDFLFIDLCIETPR